jgi:hypothetical protein
MRLSSQSTKILRFAQDDRPLRLRRLDFNAETRRNAEILYGSSEKWWRCRMGLSSQSTKILRFAQDDSEAVTA